MTHARTLAEGGSAVASGSWMSAPGRRGWCTRATDPVRGAELDARRRWSSTATGCCGGWRRTARRRRRSIPLDGAPELNNDHVLAPDGQTIYLSAKDWHIYAAPLDRRRGPSCHGRHGLDALPARREPRRRVAWRTWRSNRPAKMGYGSEPPHDRRRRHRRQGRHCRNRCRRRTGVHAGRRVDLPQHRAVLGPVTRRSLASVPTASELEQLTFDERVNWFPHSRPDGTSGRCTSATRREPRAPGRSACRIPPGRGRAVAGGLGHRPTVRGTGDCQRQQLVARRLRFAFVDYPLQEVVP